MKRLILNYFDKRPDKVAGALPSLSTCIFMDLIGFISYGIPFFGEVIDFVWAPVSAVIFIKLFGFKKGFFGGIFNFVEELLPGLDFIPTFTIVWFVHYFKRKAPLPFQPLMK